MEQKEIQMYYDAWKEHNELKAIKSLIKDNIIKNEDGVIKIKSLFFTDDLLKLIKYIDIEFYNELQQG